MLRPAICLETWDGTIYRYTFCILHMSKVLACSVLFGYTKRVQNEEILPKYDVLRDSLWAWPFGMSALACSSRMFSQFLA